MFAGACDGDDILYVYQQTSSTYQLIDKQSNGMALRSVHMAYDATYLVSVEQYAYTVYFWNGKAYDRLGMVEDKTADFMAAHINVNLGELFVGEGASGIVRQIKLSSL